jgi:hypothetical protein
MGVLDLDQLSEAADLAQDLLAGEVVAVTHLVIST